MTAAAPTDGSLNPRLRASARFDAVAKHKAEVPSTARLHCAAAVEALGVAPVAASAGSHLNLGDKPENLIHAALRDLGSLRLDEFAAVRAAAEHGRRALRALR